MEVPAMKPGGAWCVKEEVKLRPDWTISGMTFLLRRTLARALGEHRTLTEEAQDTGDLFCSARQVAMCQFS